MSLGSFGEIGKRQELDLMHYNFSVLMKNLAGSLKAENFPIKGFFLLKFMQEIELRTYVKDWLV